MISREKERVSHQPTNAHERDENSEREKERKKDAEEKD